MLRATTQFPKSKQDTVASHEICSKVNKDSKSDHIHYSDGIAHTLRQSGLVQAQEMTADHIFPYCVEARTPFEWAALNVCISSFQLEPF